jgi:hypothetical protein
MDGRYIFLCRFRDERDWRNKAITAPRDRFNKTRVLWIVVNGSTEPLKDYVQTPVKINVGSFWPESLP